MLDRNDILEVIAQHRADYERMEDTFSRAIQREENAGNDSEADFWRDNLKAAGHFKSAVASITLALNEMERGVVDDLAGRAREIIKEHV
jgi:predicted GTPase